MPGKLTVKNPVACYLAGLYSTAWTLSFSTFFWGFNGQVFPETALAQPVIPTNQPLIPPPPLRVPPPPGLGDSRREKSTQHFGIDLTDLGQETRLRFKFSASQNSIFQVQSAPKG